MDVVGAIMRELDKQGKSRRWLAIQLKIAPQAIYIMLKPDTSMRINTLAKIAGVLNVEPWKLVKDAGKVIKKGK